jgi:hypothetical protein
VSVSFSLGDVTIHVQNPDLDDKLGLDSHQVVQPKASGGYYRFALAAATDSTRDLRWSNLRLIELNDLQIFFENQAQGTLNTFLFTDERGNNCNAYFLNPTLDPVTISDEERFSGSFESGGNQIPTTQRTGGFYSLAIRIHLASPATFSTPYATTPPATSPPTEPPYYSEPTSPHTRGPTSPHTAPPEYALESDLVAHEDLTTTAHGGLIPASALVTAVGTPGSDGNVPSEKAVRTALAAATSAAEAASDAAGAAAAAAAASIPAAALVTAVGTPGSDSKVPSEKAVRTALGAATSAAEAASDAAGAAAAAAAASISTSALVTSVGSPGSNSDVPSEAAVRTAISDAISGSGFGSGDVAGPASATAGHVATFADDSGKVLSDGGAPNTLAVANLGGGAETVGGSGSNGSAATAARSDHTHAINAITAASESAPGLMAAADKTKLDGIASGATALALANLGGGAETVGGSGGNGSATTAARSDHTHAINAISEVTESADGLMIAADKTKLDGIASGATALALANLGGGAETVGGSAGNGTATTAARSDHVHAINAISAATESTAGLMAAADKTKLDGIASGATAINLANLGGGSETIGGSGSNGSAATAARSDHVHAITSWAHESNHLHGGSDVLALPDTINIGFDGGSSAIAANTLRKIYCSFACTISAVTLGHDASATMQIDVLTAAQGSLASAASICGTGTKPSTSAAQESRQTSFTNWSTTAIAAGTWIVIKVVSNDNAKETCVALEVTRT